MKPEDKDLLLKDLCGRLPYKVKIQVEGLKRDIIKDNGIRTLASVLPSGNYIEYDYLGYNFRAYIHYVKPYLHPMSSMTEEEKLMFYSDFQLDYYEHYFEVVAFQNDWLNAHHFDYRGLIDKGLAIEVTEDNNPYKD